MRDSAAVIDFRQRQAEEPRRTPMGRVRGSDAGRVPGEVEMTTVTLRLPDDTCQRLKQLAASRGISLNKLLEELGTAGLAEHDAETRFRAMARSAERRRAMAVLDRLDAVDREGAG